MEFYTPKELSQILDLHPATIRKYITDGKLKAVRIGSGWRVYKKELMIFLANCNKNNNFGGKENGK